MNSVDDICHEISRNPLACMENTTFRLCRMPVFEETDWEIIRGQHWAILGPNGGGKTTLVRALCREIPLVSGTVRFFFDAPTEKGITKSRPWFAANEIIRLSPDTPEALLGRYGGYHQARWQSLESNESPMVAEIIQDEKTGKKKALETEPERRCFPEGAADVIARLGISDLLDKRILHLSNGEARKVAIARALLLRPRILILDDPFSGLDRAAKDRLREVIESLLTGEEPLIVLVTHRVEEIPGGITHALLVDQLRVIERGTREKIIKRIAGQSAPESIMAPGPPAGCARNPQPGALPSCEPMIRMEAVSISYSGNAILRNIDWEVRPGEHWALSGPNGAGKSTLLSLILADNPQAYANRIFLFGKRRGSGESIWEIKRRIGWVAPELHGYYPVRSTGLDVVCSGFFDTIGLYRNCTPTQAEAAREQMRSLGIENLLERRISDISTGEKRLVLLARALVKHPELLILDEPCQGLDPVNRKRFIRLIDAIAGNPGISMIYITHHPDELPQSITHVMALSNGGIVHCGRKNG